MEKLTLTALAVMAIYGCSTAPTQPQTSTYSYDSKAHSGTVTVNETKYQNRVLDCEPDWRTGEAYKPNGIPLFGRNSLGYSIKVVQLDVAGNQIGETEYSFDVPANLGPQVFSKDFQSQKSYMLGTETHGIVQQGDLFTFPEGFFIRVSETEVKGWRFNSCLGIDHTYVLEDDLQSSTNPPVQLDRLIVPLSIDNEDEPVKVSFGSRIQHNVEIRVKP